MFQRGQAPPLNLALAPRSTNQQLLSGVTTPGDQQLGAAEREGRAESEGPAMQEVTYQWSLLEPGVALPAVDLEYDRDVDTGRALVRRKLGPLAIDPFIEKGGTPVGFFCKHRFWRDQIALFFDHVAPGRKPDVRRKSP